MNKEHTFKLVVSEYENMNFVFPTVNMELDSQASLGDVLDAFTCFLKAVGYFPPENSTLDFVSDDTESYDESEDI